MGRGAAGKKAPDPHRPMPRGGVRGGEGSRGGEGLRRRGGEEGEGGGDGAAGGESGDGKSGKDGGGGGGHKIMKKRRVKDGKVAGGEGAPAIAAVTKSKFQKV